MGHVMRCIALAKEFDKYCNLDALFIMKDFKEAVNVIKEKFKVVEIPIHLEIDEEISYSVDIIDQFKPEIIVTDILGINEKVLSDFKNFCKLLVSIDDIANTKFSSDIVINGHFNSRKLKYEDSGNTTYLLGPQYLILDESFSKTHLNVKKINENVTTILVTLGGSDDSKIFRKVFRSLNRFGKKYVIFMIIGPAFAHHDELNQEITNSKHKCIIEQNISSHRMAELMFEADVAIISGGNTKYELVSTGTPGLVICSNIMEVELTENIVERTHAVINMGVIDLITEEDLFFALRALLSNSNLRMKMSVLGKKEIDGMGTSRVVDKILSRL